LGSSSAGRGSELPSLSEGTEFNEGGKNNEEPLTAFAHFIGPRIEHRCHQLHSAGQERKFLITVCFLGLKFLMRVLTLSFTDAGQTAKILTI
jgi:hypothetical protein